MRHILLLHGFASSSGSRKAQFFAERFAAIAEVDFRAYEFNPTPADFSRMTISGMIDDLRHSLEEQQPPVASFIGSSMGALVALHVARQYSRVDRMLLIAPALSYRPLQITARDLEEWKGSGALPVWHYGFERTLPLHYEYHLDGLQYAEQIAPPTPVTIVHGGRDDTVPIELSRAYSAKYSGQVQLIELDTDHPMNDRLEEIWGIAQRFLLGETAFEASEDE